MTLRTPVSETVFRGGGFPNGRLTLGRSECPNCQLRPFVSDCFVDVLSVVVDVFFGVERRVVTTDVLLL